MPCTQQDIEREKQTTHQKEGACKLQAFFVRLRLPKNAKQNKSKGMKLKQLQAGLNHQW